MSKSNIISKDNLPPPIEVHNARFNDVSNQTINNILFLYPCERRNKRLLWLCQCHCGNYFLCDSKSIKNGNTSSCGCIFKEQLHKRNMVNSPDLTGKRYGLLVVLERAFIKNNRQYWKCQCDCGNIHYACGDSLSQNKIHSCGCMKSFAEHELKLLFVDNNIDYIPQYTIDDCRNNKGNILFFDFAIFNLNKALVGLIEYQGSQHDDKNNLWHTEQGEINDEIKRRYCEEHHIPLLLLYKGYDEDKLLQLIKGRWCSQ